MVVNIAYDAGGAEKSVRLMRDELRARGHDVLVIGTDLKLGGREPFADVVVPARPSRGRGSLRSRCWYQDAYRALKIAINDFEPDVIHLHTIGEFGAAALWATGEVPTVLTVHGPEPYTKKLLPWMLPANYYKNSSYHLRDVKLIGLVYYLYLRFIQLPLYRRGFRYVDMFITPSRYLAQAIKGDVGNIPVTQVYNGMVFPPAPPFRRTRNILFVGRLEAVKGVDTLLRAASIARGKVADLSVTIAGDGEDRPRLERMSASLGLGEAVQFRGWLTPEEVTACYADAEIVAVPSIWPETLASVAIEALAAGRPVVASDVGGIPEVVADGVTGRLVPSRDADMFADALVDVLTSDNSVQMSETSRQHAAKFEMRTFIDRIDSIYETLVSRAATHDLESFRSIKNGHRMTDAAIVHVVGYYPPHLGGMERVTSVLAEELAKNDQVEVLTTNCGANGAPRTERHGKLTVRRLRGREVANLPVAPGMLWQCLKIPSTSIVHVHVAQALIPEIVWFSRWIRGGEFIAHVHLDVAPSGPFGRVFVWYKKRVLGRTLRAAARVIALSEEQASFLVDSYELPPEKVTVIPNGVGPEFSPKSEAASPRGGPLRVLYVGRFTQQKALPRLIRALAAMTQRVEVLLVGEGDERPAVEDLIQRYKLDNVHLPGRLQGKELADAYRRADVFVLPSDREGMPLAALEAMASGLPIVATDVVGNRELLRGTGLLVRPDPDALAAALDQVAESETLRSELGKKSLAAAEGYTVERLVERLKRLYLEVTAKRRGGSDDDDPGTGQRAGI